MILRRFPGGASFSGIGSFFPMEPNENLLFKLELLFVGLGGALLYVGDFDLLNMAKESLRVSLLYVSDFDLLKTVDERRMVFSPKSITCVNKRTGRDCLAVSTFHLGSAFNRTFS